jgi:hypothetical protein
LATIPLKQLEKDAQSCAQALIDLLARDALSGVIHGRKNRQERHDQQSDRQARCLRL